MAQIDWKIVHVSTTAIMVEIVEATPFLFGLLRRYKILRNRRFSLLSGETPEELVARAKKWADDYRASIHAMRRVTNPFLGKTREPCGPSYM